MRLYLIRHPQPLVAPNTCYGSSDLAVTPEQVAHVAEKLRTQLPPGLPLYSSPLQRCARLAQALSTTVRFDARLAEMDFGSWEMQQWEQIPRAEIDAWSQDIAHYHPGHGKSLTQVAHSIRAFYDDLVQQNIAEAIVVCHAGSIRLLLTCPLKLTAVEMAHRAADQPNQIDYGAMITLDDTHPHPS